MAAPPPAQSAAPCWPLLAVGLLAARCAFVRGATRVILIDQEEGRLEVRPPRQAQPLPPAVRLARVAPCVQGGIAGILFSFFLFKEAWLRVRCWAGVGRAVPPAS